MKTKITIGLTDYTKHSTLPLQQQETADESLDAGYFEIKQIDQEAPIKPFTKVHIEQNDGDDTEDNYFYVAKDDATKVIKNNKSNHDLTLIEETKELERYMVDVKTITNPVVHDYLANPQNIMVNGSTTTYWIFTSHFYVTFDIKSPQEKNKTMTIPRPYFLLQKIQEQADTWDGGSIVNVELKIKDPDNEQVWYGYDGWSSIPTERTFDFTPTKTGKYKFIINGTSTLGITEGEMEFTLEVMEKQTPKADWTIQGVCETLLATCECLRVSETPRFTLASVSDYAVEDQAEITKLFAMKSPEFSFTKCTLFEALKQVGEYIHAIPRLRQNKVYFDLLGTMKECNVDLEKYISKTESQSIDDFCSELDSNVENLLNTDDESQGSIEEPFNNGFKTIRVESGTAQITEDGMIIATEYPIYDVLKLEGGYLSDGRQIGDITPFVYENAEYQAGLSSSSDTFPSSKMYALKFTQGQKNITELNFKNEHVISSAFESYSILNIIHKKLNLASNWWSNFWDTEDVLKLQFRVTYIPMVSARVKQTKSNIIDMAFKSVLAHNQSANMVSSNAYGENLRGAIAKYGNPDKKLMLICNKLSQIPKINTKYGDYVITSVKKEIYNNHTKVEVGLSKKFNNKSAFVSINSQKRYYEVSEKASYNRFVIYEDYCIIGDEETSDNKSLITSEGINALINSFNSGTNNNVGVVKAKGYMANDTALIEVVKPVVSLGIGNSILLAYSYDDNYSAGNKVSENNSTRYQEYVNYADKWGEIEKLDVHFGKVADLEYNYNMALSKGDNTPQGTALPDGEYTKFFSTGTDPIKLKKDSREKFTLSYQLHFITNRNNLIIGSGFGRKNTFTTEDTLNYKLYVLPHKINEFDKTVDLTGATELSLSVASNGTQRIKIQDVTPNVSGYAWAIVNAGTDNDLVFGENINITDGEEISLPYLTFTRSIRD